MSNAFEDTRWSLIQRAASDDEIQREEAWREFHRLYRDPLLCFIRSYGWSEHDAADLLQSFLAKTAEKNWLGDAEQENVKLRSFLLLRLKRHLNDVRKFNRAKKRGGGTETLSSSDDESILGADLNLPSHDVQREFDRRWAKSILDRALCRLREDAERRGNLSVYEVLQAQLTEDSPSLVEEAADRLEKSEGAVRMILKRQRDRLSILIREEVADTLPCNADVRDEVRYLAEVLGTSG